ETQQRHRVEREPECPHRDEGDTGNANPVMTVDLHELRKTKTTSTVRNAPSSSASSTFRTESATRLPASRTTSICTPGGSVFSISSTCLRIFPLTSVVL